MKLMSLESFLVAKRITFWAPEGTTLAEVLAKVVPHMGEDLVPYAQPVRFYDGARFRDALVAAGFALAEIDSHDLYDVRADRTWLDPNVKADLERALEQLSGVPLVAQQA